MSWLGRLFGTEKAMTAAVESVRDGLDALVYTDEEKAQAAAADRSEARKMFIEWVRNSQGQNLARRILALMIAATWLGQYMMVQVMLVAGVWVDSQDIADRLKASASIIGGRADAMTGAMMLILGFYFAAPHLGAIVQGAMARFGQQREAK
jgi:hypothetical protein